MDRKRKLLELNRKKEAAKKKREFLALKEIIEYCLKNQEVQTEIKVSNLDDVYKKLKEFPTEFSIKNVEDFKKVFRQEKFPESIKVDNLSDIKLEVKTEKVSIPDSFRISNLDDLKQQKIEFPSNLKKLSFANVENFVSDIKKNFLGFTKSIKEGIFVKNTKTSDAISVRLVSSDGRRFVNPNLGGGGTYTGTIEENQEKILEKLDLILEASGGGYELAYGKNVLISDYYYTGYQLIGGTKWRIKRMSKINYSIEWSNGDSDMATSWADKENLIFNASL